MAATLDSFGYTGGDVCTLLESESVAPYSKLRSSEPRQVLLTVFSQNSGRQVDACSPRKGRDNEKGKATPGSCYISAGVLSSGVPHCSHSVWCGPLLRVIWKKRVVNICKEGPFPAGGNALGLLAATDLSTRL
jgi:hypothetical protein